MRRHHAQPAASAVHQRWRRHRHQRRAGGAPCACRRGELRGALKRRLAEHGRVGFVEEARELAHRISHALGHAGSATGVEHVELIALRLDARRRFRIGLNVVVAQRACHHVTPIGTGSVLDFDQEFHARHQLAHARHPISQRAVIDQRLDIGVIEQVSEFLVEIAVIDVDRHAAHLHRGEIGFAVLGRVVEVHADPRMRAESAFQQTLGEPRRALLVLCPGVALRALHDRDFIRYCVGDRFPDRPEMRFDHVAFPW